ncbi:MAG TPA: M1 family aminopeptidase [Candidatus Polarisedimenticolaceae bacterium]|nr:M1 family aminopeptidase [Candidatus Polarisedimenticolaceae bacterium]
MSRTAVAVVVTALSLLVPAAAAATPPAELWAEIRAARLDPARAVSVSQLNVDLGLGTLLLGAGVLVPAAPVDGQVWELVFLGDARFQLEPPDAVEGGQLELFTGRPRMDEPVGPVILVTGNGELTARLLDRAAATLSAEQTRAASELLARWVSGAERRGFGADVALLGAAVGDRASRGYFAAWCHSEALHDFYYVLDPTDPEQVVLGQFVPLELDEVEQERAERELRRAQRRGNGRQLRVADLGAWDTWLSTRPGTSGVEPEHYALEATIRREDRALSGRARLELRAVVADLRLITLQLAPDLAVRAVRDGAGQDRFWLQSGATVAVLLPQPTRAGDRFSLTVDYAGTLLNEYEQGIYVNGDTYRWYPRAGDIDRATYEVTLRWPDKYQLLASGRVVERGEQDHQLWERRVLDVPAIAFSFEIGDFDVVQDRVGHVELTFGFSRASGSFDRGGKPAVVATVKQSLQFFEEKFGRYPLDFMTVASIPRGYSQGYLGFVTLAQGLFWTPSYSWRRLQSSTARTETIAHEISHQWWGNKVGFAGYRDQWLSEALADYSEMLFTREQAKLKGLYLRRRKVAWQVALQQQAKDGRALTSIGPVVLGQRLSSSRSEDAYQAVVYTKGSVVFSTLARQFEEPAFLDMLHKLADAVNNRSLETATFLKALSRMSGADLTAFTEQFVYGSSVPDVDYDVEYARRPAGGWTVRGEARRVGGGHSRWTLERLETGGWALRREFVPEADAAELALAVPFHVYLREPGAPDTLAASKLATGTVPLSGTTSRFEIEVELEPVDFELDPYGEVLANFLLARERPKLSAHFAGRRALLRTDFAAAEQALNRALAAPLQTAEEQQDERVSERDRRRRTIVEDARIHLDLAYLELDRRRPAEAQRELQSAEDLLRGLDDSIDREARLLLASRLSVMQGDFRAAYSRLNALLYLELPHGDSVFQDLRREKYRDGLRIVSMGDGYALLAVAAHETQHALIARAALKAAEERGVDMQALKPLLAPAE